MNDAVSTNKKYGTLADDILLTFLMTFTFAAYSFEARLDSGGMSVFRHVLLAVFLLTWIITAVKNGIGKKVGFAVYTALYWLVPGLITLLFYNGPEILRHSVTMYTLSELSAILTTRPAEILGGYFGLPAEMSMIIIMLIIFGAFFIGFAVSGNIRNSKSQG